LFQDPDVLDTWFSSALWPFSTLGWPNQSQDLQAFYPTSTLVTGLDILFFWVSRMIMMGLKFTGEVPFRDVYIHALVRDAEGQKMSKSKGNVIDPLTKMQEYGTDALRFTLASMASPGRDIKLAEERIEGYRNFVTKIWNAARFILLHANGQSEIHPAQERSFADRWILARLNQVIQGCTSALESYRFDRAASILYQFLWHEYCDWYIELVKPILQGPDSVDARSTRHTLLESYEIIQRLLHPFMPFLTEEIWQALPHQGNTIVLGPFPQENKDWEAPDIEAAFTKLEQFVNATRTSRALLNCGPSQSLIFLGTSKNANELDTLNQVHHHLQHLSRGTVQLSEDDNWPSTNILRLVVGSIVVGIKIEGDIDLQNALKRIKKQIQEKQKEITRLEKRLASPDFVAKAEPEVVQESTERLKVLKEEMALLMSSEAQLQTMLGK
jgi:valyl-tRNA synthetase